MRCREAFGEDGDLAVLLFIGGVRDTGAVRDEAHAIVQPQLEGDSIGEGGLSASAMSENDEVPDV